LGHTVVADCVNPVQESRAAWRATAATAGVALVDIQIVCSDTREHLRRVESRESDIPGLIAPSWQSVLVHEYEPWDDAPLTVDTAQIDAAQAVEKLLKHLRR